MGQRFTHTGYLFGSEIATAAAEREAADVTDIGAHAGRAVGGQLLRILGAAVRRRRQILWMMGQSGHRRCVPVRRGSNAMHDAHLAVAIAVRR